MTNVDILINNYNYDAFLGEAIESVLAQSHTKWRLIIVDDGSTDGSRAIIERYANRDERITAIYKTNGGQLSAFNAGYAHSNAPFVFFLDADDRFHPNYIARALDIYSAQPTCDFLFVAQEFIGSERRINILKDTPLGLSDLGFSSYITACQFLWIGERTSAVSLRRTLANRMFPIAMEADWSVQADNCVIWMSSILGGRKFYLAEPLIDYRIHGNNGWYGKEKSAHDAYAFQLKEQRFFARIQQNHPYLFTHKHGPAEFARTLIQEARTGDKPLWLLNHYLPVVKKLKLSLMETRRTNRRLNRLIAAAEEKLNARQ